MKLLFLLLLLTTLLAVDPVQATNNLPLPPLNGGKKKTIYNRDKSPKKKPEGDKDMNRDWDKKKTRVSNMRKKDTKKNPQEETTSKDDD